LVRGSRTGFQKFRENFIYSKDFPEPPKDFVHFLEKCIECIGLKEGDTSIKQ
jgi:hypothetical protein